MLSNLFFFFDTYSPSVDPRKIGIKGKKSASVKDKSHFDSGILNGLEDLPLFVSTSNSTACFLLANICHFLTKTLAGSGSSRIRSN